MNALVTMNASPAAAMSVSDVEKIAGAIAKGGLFGSKDPYAVLTLCLLAQAEGQHPAVVFRDYHIISGKPAKKADAMLRDFLSAGGKVEWHTLDDTKADATFSHPSGTARIDWTIERAKRAQLTTPMWSKYPRQMLRSRVISEGVRTVYPGATSGLYVPEEVQAFEPASDAPAVESAPEPQMIEHQPDSKPAWPEGPATGIMKLKQAIRDMKTKGNAATGVGGFNEVVANYQGYLDQLEALQHEWWLGRDRDGNEFEGVPAWITRRRGELDAGNGSYQSLIDSLSACDTYPVLTDWLEAHGDEVEALDGEQSRKFQAEYAEREAAIAAMDSVSIGA